MTAQKIAYCNDYDPRPGGGDARYAFAQAVNETTAQAVIRAAQTVLATGVNEVAHYVGTNHVMANNAAFAFSDDVLAQLKESEDSSEDVVAAAELLELRKAQVAYADKADELDKVSTQRQSDKKGMAFAFAKNAANKERANAQKCVTEIKRLGAFIPAPK